MMADGSSSNKSVNDWQLSISKYNDEHRRRVQLERHRLVLGPSHSSIATESEAAPRASLALIIIIVFCT